MTRFLRSPGLMAAWLVVTCLIAVLFPPEFASAAELTTSGGFVVLPWGDVLAEVMKAIVAFGVPPFVGWLCIEIARLFPALRKILTDKLIDRMVRLAADFALQAIEGCAKGQTVPINLGSAAVATATVRAINSTIPFVVQQAGGAQGIAERVFRHLDLEPGASNDNTLAPALARLGVKAG